MSGTLHPRVHDPLGGHLARRDVFAEIPPVVTSVADPVSRVGSVGPLVGHEVLRHHVGRVSAGGGHKSQVHSERTQSVIFADLVQALDDPLSDGGVATLRRVRSVCAPCGAKQQGDGRDRQGATQDPPTKVGTSRFSRVPSPNCPSTLYPQQNACPEVVLPQVCAPLA